jgi:hypothetical protein
MEHKKKCFTEEFHDETEILKIIKSKPSNYESKSFMSNGEIRRNKDGGKNTHRQSTELGEKKAETKQWMKREKKLESKHKLLGKKLTRNEAGDE